jgi:hypothetical protein
MKLNKATIYYYDDCETYDKDAVENWLDNHKYLSGIVVDVESVEIGEFHDNIDINYINKQNKETYEKYFYPRVTFEQFQSNQIYVSIRTEEDLASFNRWLRSYDYIHMDSSSLKVGWWCCYHGGATFKGSTRTYTEIHQLEGINEFK